MRRPVDTSLRPTAPGTAETGQPERDLAEHGCDLMGPVVLDLTRCRARSAGRPLSGMAAALRRDQRLLDLAHKPLAIHQAQSKISEVAEVTRADNFQHVNAPDYPLDPGFHQTQNQPHPQSPAVN